MLIKVGLVTQKFTGPFLWITHLINELKHASSPDEDQGWALTSAREVSDLEMRSSFGKEWGQVGQSGLPGFCIHL